MLSMLHKLGPALDQVNNELRQIGPILPQVKDELRQISPILPQLMAAVLARFSAQADSARNEEQAA